MLLLQVLLGLQPDRRRGQLITRAPEELPSWAGRSLRLTGIRAFDRAWDVASSSTGTSPLKRHAIEEA